MKKLVILLTAISLSCSAVAKKNIDQDINILDSRTLWQIHTDLRYTYFYYDDGSVVDGLLLRWNLDTIKIVPDGFEQPILIESMGINKIEIVSGNKIFKYLAFSGPIAAGMLLIDNSGDSGSSIASLAAPMLVVASAIFGASRDKTTSYKVSPDFTFDYEKEKSLYEFLKD